MVGTKTQGCAKKPVKKSCAWSVFPRKVAQNYKNKKADSR